MVKLGIICEGETEVIHFDTPSFRQFLSQFDLELIGVIETGSKTQYFGDRLPKYRDILLGRGAERIITLIDLDCDVCITLTKEAIPQFNDQTVVVAVKEFENWYLADSKALMSFTGSSVEILTPEEDTDAITTIVNLGITSKRFKRFPKSKPRLAKAMLNNGFTVENAANHPNCPSAQYFLTKLKTLASAGR